MTVNPRWRAISAAEVAVVTAIVSASGDPQWEAMIERIADAIVSHETEWILDIRGAGAGHRTDIPNGPLPVRAFVPSRAAYDGEIVVWVENGQVSGLEFAWVTDTPPTRWPRPEEMEIVSV